MLYLNLHNPEVDTIYREANRSQENKVFASAHTVGECHNPNLDPSLTPGPNTFTTVPSTRHLITVQCWEVKQGLLQDKKILELKYRILYGTSN